MSDAREVFFIAGEVSGDRHAAPVVRALVDEGLRVCGVGGKSMADAGAELLADATDWGAIGITESVRRYPGLCLQARRLRRIIAARRPAVVVLVDFGYFNCWMARQVKKAGLSRVVYYFPPGSWRQQARDWSWLASITDLVLTPFSVNAGHLQASGVNVRWVGHPVVDMLSPAPDRAALRGELGLPPTSPCIGLLPGSRGMERGCLGPKMLQAAAVIRDAVPSAHFLWSSVDRPGGTEAALNRRLQGLAGVTAVADSHRILRASDLVVTKMGTVTLEAAAALTPMVATYDGPWLAKFFFDAIQRHAQRFYAMPNLLMGEQIVPEVVPDSYRQSVTGAARAHEALALLGDPAATATMQEGLGRVREKLGEPGVSQRVARWIALAATQDSDLPL